jgi:uncharacterized membrane protein
MIREVLTFALLLAWCAALLTVRVLRSGTLMYGFLAWNLFLAAVPLFAAAMLERSRSTPMQTVWLTVWLGFLPNAPYIVTDFVHLRPRPGIPLWYDIALLASCAATGLLLGYASVADVQRFLARKFGELQAWLFSTSALILCGAGIYLGRFLRWNTWDVLFNPIAIVASIRPRVLSVTVVYGLSLVIGYLAFRALSSAERARN